MLCTTCMRKTDSNCLGCENFESIKTHSLNLAKAIKLTIKRNEQPKLSGKDWALIVTALESVEVEDERL